MVKKLCDFRLDMMRSGGSINKGISSKLSATFFSTVDAVDQMTLKDSIKRQWVTYHFLKIQEPHSYYKYDVFKKKTYIILIFYVWLNLRECNPQQIF